MNLKEIKEFKKKFPSRAFGIGHFTTTNNGIRRGLQFYDYDGSLNQQKLRKILSIFPNDCIIYKSKNGFHFYSFTLIDSDLARTRANGLTESFNEIGDKQDYKSKTQLILRISPKFLDNKIISEETKFLKYIKLPVKNKFVSKTHLDFFLDFKELPKRIYYAYKYNSILVDASLALNYYHTRNKEEVTKNK